MKFESSKINYKNKFNAKLKESESFAVKFSFKYFNSTINEKKYYPSETRNKDDLFKFMDGCCRICEFTWYELKKDKQFHCHEIDNLIFTDPEIKEWTPLQIKLPSLKQERIIGFLDNEHTFNVVKFDKAHQVYPRK